MILPDRGKAVISLTDSHDNILLCPYHTPRCILERRLFLQQEYIDALTCELCHIDRWYREEQRARQAAVRRRKRRQ